MNGKTTQLPLLLRPAEPFSLKYFVVHSGTAEAYAVLDQALREFSCEVSAFKMIYLHGPAGSGKTHLLRGFCRAFADKGMLEEHSYFAELALQGGLGHGITPSAEWVSEFVSRYEQIKASGGIVVVASQAAPGSAADNPHAQSRFQAGSVIELGYPEEDELPAVVHSLLERHNLRLSETSLKYLLRRLPRDPLSFDNIFARISELSLEENKPAGLSLVKDAVNEIKD